jgi:hypothetical protein
MTKFITNHLQSQSTTWYHHPTIIAIANFQGQKTQEMHDLEDEYKKRIGSLTT